MRSTTVAMIHCNAQTTPKDVIEKLTQCCMMINTNTGRVLKPRESEKLVLYLKDLNLPKPDKWGTSMLVAFLRQLISFTGFYDDNLEFVGISNIQLVASMNPSSTLGRSDLNSRFTSIIRVLYVDYTTEDQLQHIYASMLTPILKAKTSDFSSSSKVTKLACFMISLYLRLRKEFSVDDHSHYLFTPKLLTDWCLGLLRYDFGA